MNEREINFNTTNDTTTALRPWIEPAFERVKLHEAMSGVGVPTGGDTSTYRS